VTDASKVLPIVGVISGVFDPFMSPYIELERKNMEEMLDKAVTEDQVDRCVCMCVFVCVCVCCLPWTCQGEGEGGAQDQACDGPLCMTSTSSGGRPESLHLACIACCLACAHHDSHPIPLTPPPFPGN
jgi:hypothetical protein